MSTWVRLSLFNSSLIFLAQVNNLEASNHKISSISLLTINKTKTPAIIETGAEAMAEAEVKAETETEIMIVVMETEAEVKITGKITIIINEDLESTAMSV